MLRGRTRRESEEGYGREGRRRKEEEGGGRRKEEGRRKEGTF
jgi:hypothetical protein